MNFPTLRCPRLCRFIPYIVVLTAFIGPMILIGFLPFLPEFAKFLLIVGLCIALIVYIFRNFAVLMGMDLTLAMLSCWRTAKTQYPVTCSARTILRRAAHYGTNCAPIPQQPQPEALRYSFSASATVYARGIERVVAVYHVDTLEQENYRAVFSSAKANSQALMGRKKALFLEPKQKAAPLHRVTVVMILARQIEPSLHSRLYDLVCKRCGSEEENCILPCIVDLSRNICVFNSQRIPYVGFGYAVKNRGIRLIRKLIWGGRLPVKGNPYDLPHDEKDAMALDQSIWSFWHEMQAELGLEDSKTAAKLKALSDRQISIDEDTLLMKWGEQAIMQYIYREEKTVYIEEPDYWVYPKCRPIAEKTVQSMKEAISQYFQGMGWSVRYGDFPPDGQPNDTDD